MQAIILAGGRGERMRPFTDTAPKPMVPIAGKPLIEHQLNQLRKSGITDVVVYESYLSDVLQQHLGNGSALGMNIEHRVVDFSLGSAGVIKDALLRLHDGQRDAVFLFGDIISDINLEAMLRQHESDRPYITIAGIEDKSPFGSASLAGGRRVIRFEEKPTDYHSTGVYVVSKEMATRMPDSGDFSKDALKPLVDRGLYVFEYIHDGYWWDVRDMNVVEDIERSVREGKITIEMSTSSAEAKG